MTIDEQKAEANLDDVIKQDKLEKITDEILKENHQCSQCGFWYEIGESRDLICPSCGFNEADE